MLIGECQIGGGRLTPTRVIETLSTIIMLEVWFKVDQARCICLPRTAKTESDEAAILRAKGAGTSIHRPAFGLAFGPYFSQITSKYQRKCKRTLPLGLAARSDRRMTKDRAHRSTPISSHLIYPHISLIQL